mgnify:CR=1 FL=1
MDRDDENAWCKDLLDEAYKPHIKVYGSNYSDYQNRPGTYYGYGWFIEPEKKCIYHTGDNGGFKNLAARYPEKKGLVLVFAARNDWDRYKVKTQIEEIFDLVPSESKENEGLSTGVTLGIVFGIIGLIVIIIVIVIILKKRKNGNEDIGPLEKLNPDS